MRNLYIWNKLRKPFFNPTLRPIIDISLLFTGARLRWVDSYQSWVKPSHRWNKSRSETSSWLISDVYIWDSLGLYNMKHDKFNPKHSTICACSFRFISATNAFWIAFDPKLLVVLPFIVWERSALSFDISSDIWHNPTHFIWLFNRWLAKNYPLVSFCLFPISSF